MIERRARDDDDERTDGGAARPRRPDPTPLDVAATMLQRGPQSEAELNDKLVAKGYRPETAARTVDRCRELGWVGDETFATDRARSLRRRGAGTLKILADLVGRGIPEALAERAADASLDDESERDWARRALESSGHRADPARAWRFLASRGFPEEVIADLVELPDFCD